MIKRLAIIIALIMSVALTGCTLIINGKEVTSIDLSGGNTRAEKTDIQEVELDKQDELSVNNTVGKINFKEWDGNTIKITSLKKVRTSGSQKKADNMLKDIKIDIEKNSESINVKVRYKNIFGWLNRRSVEMEVLIPEKMKNIEGSSASGEITMRDIKGMNELDLSSISGSVNVTNCSSETYKFGTTSGKLYISGFSGDGRIKTVSGGVELKNIKGKTECKSTSGRISAEGFEGKVDSDAVSGSLDFNDSIIKDGSSFHTISGSINVDTAGIDSKGDYKISSISGSVNMSLPENSQFNLSAKSISGSINNSFEGTFESSNHHVTGKVGDGGAEINISTTSGSININK